MTPQDAPGTGQGASGSPTPVTLGVDGAESAAERERVARYEAASTSLRVPVNWELDPDPVTYDPCDQCKHVMPDFERASSELTTMTGHTECMGNVDMWEAGALQAVEADACEAVYLTEIVSA